MPDIHLKLIFTIHPDPKIYFYVSHLYNYFMLVIYLLIFFYHWWCLSLSQISSNKHQN